MFRMILCVPEKNYQMMKFIYYTGRTQYTDSIMTKLFTMP